MQLSSHLLCEHPIVYSIFSNLLVYIYIPSVGRCYEGLTLCTPDEIEKALASYSVELTRNIVEKEHRTFSVDPLEVLDLCNLQGQNNRARLAL